MLLRLIMMLVAVGGVLCLIGYQENKVGGNTSEQPLPTSLVQIEHGITPANNHVEFGDHVAVYEALVCAYEESAFGLDDFDEQTRVEYVYYPIVSPGHPYVGLASQRSQARSEEGSEQGIPGLDQFSVIVRSSRFKKVGDLPQVDFRREQKVQGMVVNQIASLGSDEKDLLHEAFPKLDLDKVLILQENRRPMSASTAYAMMGGGGVLILVGGVLLVANRWT